MIFEKLTALIADHTGADAAGIARETTLSSLGIDSLETVEMLMELEEDLGVEIELQEKLNTVGELADYIQEKVGE